MGVHDQHRQRLKERFLKEGLDTFSEHEVLELLLYYCLSRIDTNPIAHELIDSFGSLPNVLDADADELKKIKGIGDHAATFLSVISAASRYYQVEKASDITVVKSVEDFGHLLVPRFSGRRNEVVYMLCLDAKCKMICCRKVGEGSVNSAGVSVRRIVELALAVNATSVVLAHNHPSGIAIPSQDDARTTLRVASALKAVDVILLDHIVVSENDYVSMAQSGFYRLNDVS